MSADRWSTCPRCKVRFDEARKDYAARTDALYGQVSAEEFMQFLAREERPQRPSDTLREDYEVYMRDTGVLCIDYYASCEACGFQFHYENEESANLAEDEG
jgi:hypothetical protein